jgi:hypothetical protein
MPRLSADGVSCRMRIGSVEPTSSSTAAVYAVACSRDRPAGFEKTDICFV